MVIRAANLVGTRRLHVTPKFFDSEQVLTWTDFQRMLP
jgi:hypothetical protein